MFSTRDKNKPPFEYFIFDKITNVSREKEIKIQERGEVLNDILSSVDLRPNRGLSSSANIATITCPDNMVTVASYNNNNTIYISKINSEVNDK